MSAVLSSRVNYFDRQFIRLAEMRDEQAYHLQLHRRHNLSHHSWGIVVGLELLQEEGRPVVRPGLAVDGYGRELLLLERGVFGRDQFDRFGTSRLDLWLEYRLELSEDRQAAQACGGDVGSQPYRATERAAIVATRGGALPDPRRPPGVPATAFDEPMLATPDDPRNRWPVYLGRIAMDIPAQGAPTFTIDAANRVYAGVNAELIDHPGNACRIELGRTSPDDSLKQVGTDEYRYAADQHRDFAVFAPGEEPSPLLQPTLSIYDTSTQIRGTAVVHGDLVLDGTALQFPAGGAAPAVSDPAIYRTGEELRIDVGSLDAGDRLLVIGVTKGGEFQKALEIRFEGSGAGSKAKPVVTVFGDLHLEGTITSPDIRTRTVTEEVAALLTGMVQAAVMAGSN